MNKILCEDVEQRVQPDSGGQAAPEGRPSAMLTEVSVIAKTIFAFGRGGYYEQYA